MERSCGEGRGRELTRRGKGWVGKERKGKGREGKEREGKGRNALSWEGKWQEKMLVARKNVVEGWFWGERVKEGSKAQGRMVVGAAGVESKGIRIVYFRQLNGQRRNYGRL